MWGLHPIHVPLEQTVDEEAPPDLHAQQRRKRPSDAASQEGETSHLQAPPRSSHYNSPDLSAGSPHTRPSLDPSINFIFIDDDVSTLRKQLILIKNSAPQLQLPTHLLNKRPGLQSRRTRSSAQMKPNAGSAPVNSQLAVIYFTSLSKFRYIRELVQSIFRSASQVLPLPEVFVLPKPAGPRRLLTSLHTAIKKPLIDASVAPIATSPSSPGGHFYVTSSAKASPAPSNHQEFDAAFGAHAHALEQGQPLSSPRTPPLHSGTLSPAESSSPRPNSAEANEYLDLVSQTTKDIGEDVSSGVLLHDTEGKAAGLFFNPKRGTTGPNMSDVARPAAVQQSNTPKESREGSIEELDHRQSDEDFQVPPSPASSKGKAPSQMTTSPLQTPVHVVTPSGKPLESTGEKAEDMSTEDVAPVDGAERAVPLKTAFVPRAFPQTHRSLSDNIATTPSSPMTVSPPPLNRMATTPVTAPIAPVKPAGHDGSNSILKLAQQSARHADQTDRPVLSNAAPSNRSSPTPAGSSANASNTAASSSNAAAASRGSPGPNKSEPANTISGSPAAILARSSGRKPRNEIVKNKRKITNPVIPPVNVLIVEGRPLPHCISRTPFLMPATDNRIEQVVVSTFLRRQGIRCSVAANGQEAVDKWKKGGFHLVLVSKRSYFFFLKVLGS